MAINDIIRATIKQRLHGQNVFNVLHFRQNLSAGTLPILRDHIVNDWIGPITNVQSNELVYESLELQTIRPELMDGRIFDLGGVTGDILGESLPSYCAVVMPAKTGLGGRSNRGRVYVAGIPESHQKDSVLTDAAADLWQPAIAAITSRFLAGPTTFQMGVWSRKRAAEIPAPSTLPFGLYSSISFTRPLATMRSRKVGIGS